MTVLAGGAGLSPLFDLKAHGDATALLIGTRVLTYAELDGLVEDRLAKLGSTRRLILLECANVLDPVVTYLAALRGRHPVLLLPRTGGAAAIRHRDRLIDAYDPDVLYARTDAAWELVERHEQPAHVLHPDLAVLLGTSGSTGTPKLVRLSEENLRSNAAGIADYLGLDASSRAATTLPFQYCYGLSVLNSHLLVGGSLWLTDTSVVDPVFWPDFAAAGATSFAGVPYTFDLLERSGADWTAAPGLRQVTQAGGRMAPDRIREVAVRAERCGVELFVMYGQTEATARMAYLPPGLVTERPECIGIPIEGGELRLDDGELVYSGPNVMLGYAESPADLALGRTVTELRTGDLAVQHDDGLFEIVGRRNRLAKLYGVRLDLDHAERLLADHGVEARLVADAECLRAFVLDGSPAALGRSMVDLLTAEHCLPAHAVQVQPIAEFPRTATGKPDYAALGDLPKPTTPRLGDVREAFAGVFGTDVAPGDTFVGLGGDSLSYVETFVRLERLLGEVPQDWPHRTVAELSALTVTARRHWAAVELPVLLRAIAIVVIVGSHTELWNIIGGSHTLLVLFGFGLARFALGVPTRRERLRAMGRMIRDMAVPTVLWVAPVALVTGVYHWQAAALITNVSGSRAWNDDWHLWFLESAIWTTLAIAALVAVPGVARLLDRFPFAVPVVLLGLALVLRESTTAAGVLINYTIPRTAWCVVLGWVVQAARTPAQRCCATALVLVSVVGFFPGDPNRTLVVLGSVLALLWVRHLWVPRPLDRALATIASASLFIYITHWQVYPHLEKHHQFLACLVSLLFGIAVWKVYTTGRRSLVRRARGPAQRRAAVAVS